MRRYRNSPAIGGSDYDWRKVEARLSALPHFVTEIDGLDIHFIHVAFHARGCAAAHRHAWVARLDHRAAEDHRAADRSNIPWRECCGRIPSGDPLDARLRPFWKAKHDRLGARSASPAPGTVLMKRLGYEKFVAQGGDWGALIARPDGSRRASGIARHPYEHGGCNSARNRCSGLHRS